MDSKPLQKLSESQLLMKNAIDGWLSIATL